MLCGETRALARKLAQPFGMTLSAEAGSRPIALRAVRCFDQARKGAMTGSALARPASRLIDAPSFAVKRASSAFACAGSKPRVN